MKRGGKIAAAVAGGTLAVGLFSAPAWASSLGNGSGPVDQPGTYQVMDRGGHGAMDRDRDRTHDHTRDQTHIGAYDRTQDRTHQQLRDGTCR